MDISEIISLLSGIALFLFGMTLMGDGLKRVAGNRLELVLYRLSSTTLRGVLLGTGVTGVIQSSCATSVMVVGFVNANMMKRRQAIGVILGAILGTSVTGWVVSLSYLEGSGDWQQLLSTNTLTGLVAVTGVILRVFSKDQTRHHIGDILMGFAVLMFGMHTMSGAVSGLKEQPWFTKVLSSLSNPVLGILVGTVFTAILQSASAAVGIVQALSASGAMAMETALPLLMGVAIGASFPVLLSALGANTDGKRTAWIYLVASTIGVLVCASIFYLADTIFRFEFLLKTMNPFSLAMVNSVLRLVMVLLLLPFIDAFNIDLKGFSQDVYDVCGGTLEQVKETIACASASSHVEVTTLLIPGLNDDFAQLEREAQWLASLDPVPTLHLTRFFPRYLYAGREPTPLETLYRARELAERYLDDVILGNM